MQSNVLHYCRHIFTDMHHVMLSYLTISVEIQYYAKSRDQPLIFYMLIPGSQICSYLKSRHPEGLKHFSFKVVGCLLT